MSIGLIALMMRKTHNRTFLFAGLLLGMLLVSTMVSARVCPPDSIGTVTVDGKTYVLHQVDPGETLFSLARRYQVSVAEIQNSNSMNGTGLRVGQKLRIPRKEAPATSTSSDGFVENHPSNNDKIHIVMRGQTLFAIARHYQISVGEIKRINKLGSDEIKVGQMLWIKDPAVKQEPQISVENTGNNEVEATNAGNGGDNGGNPEEGSNSVGPTAGGSDGTHTVQAGETLYAIARKYGMSVIELKKMNRLESGAISVGQELKIKKSAGANNMAGGSGQDGSQIGGSDAQSGSMVVEENPTVKSEWVIPPEAKKELYKDKSTGKNYYRVTETGNADQLVNGAEVQTKFYAKHKFLPKGSVVFVECPPTGQTVLLKVEGRLPAEDQNVIRLSKKAMEYLLMEGPKQVVLKYSLPAE